METLISLVNKAKSKDKRAMQQILTKFHNKVERSLNQTNIQDRDDLKQEIQIKIVEAVYKYDPNSIPGFWEFVDNEDL